MDRNKTDEDRDFETDLANGRNSTVIGILDMDAFEVQIYLNDKYGPQLGWEIYKSRPFILLDSTTDRIISVNYEAKRLGVSRSDNFASAIRKCPQLENEDGHLRKDTMPGSNKPEGFKLRHASWAVLDSIIQIRRSENLPIIVEYATNDEFYIDLTQVVNYRLKRPEEYPVDIEGLGFNTHLEGNSKYKGPAIVYRADWIHKTDAPKYWQESRLIQGAIVLEQIRQNIFTQTNFEASGGVSTNKLLAKLACPLHKPGGMTILPEAGLWRISRRIPVQNLPTLGGKIGQTLRNVFKNGGPMTMAQLANIPVPWIKRKTGFGQETAMKITKLANGISNEPVMEKLMKESLTVGRSNLRSLRLFVNDANKVQNLLHDLLDELLERLKEEKSRHKRIGENVRFEFHTFLRGHRGRNPGIRGFTIQPESLRDLDNLNVELILNDAVGEFCNIFRNSVGMIVKVNLIVKNFVPLITVNF